MPGIKDLSQDLIDSVKDILDGNERIHIKDTDRFIDRVDGIEIQNERIDGKKQSLMERKSRKNDDEDEDEEENLDPVNKKAVKKKFKDREDKDIDNDGDEDESDRFLHKRRKAVAKALKAGKKKKKNDDDEEDDDIEESRAVDMAKILKRYRRLKDKDIDNDGDVDPKDRHLYKMLRLRKASRERKEEVDVDEGIGSAVVKAVKAAKASGKYSSTPTRTRKAYVAYRAGSSAYHRERGSDYITKAKKISTHRPDGAPAEQDPFSHKASASTIRKYKKHRRLMKKGQKHYAKARPERKIRKHSRMDKISRPVNAEEVLINQENIAEKKSKKSKKNEKIIINPTLEVVNNPTLGTAIKHAVEFGSTSGADSYKSMTPGQIPGEITMAIPGQGQNIQEKSPPSPEAERFIKKNKDSFKKNYGSDWERVLYSTAWKMHGKHWK